MPVILKSRDEIAIMRQAGRHVAEVLQILAAEVRPGISVLDLDRVVRREFKQRKVTPTFLGYHGYPATVCVSVNDQIVHGIPRERILEDGDIVSIDLGCTYRGFVGDSAVTVPCGAVTPEALQLIKVTEAALWKGICALRPDVRIGDVGHAIQSYVEPYGMGVVRDYVGHGVGRAMHEDPQVPNYGTPGSGKRLKSGTVVAIEPMVNLGSHETRRDPDGWTVWTKDGSLSAHFEHTIAVTPDGPEVLTLL
ncbi:MAG: type I methionyl aminopeptidase [Dehalococcoidia bacterium]